MNSDNYRKISDAQIEQLCRQGCTAADWSQIYVADGFDASRCQRVHFSGHCTIGCQDAHFEDEYGIIRYCGIYDAVVHECQIANDVYISKVRECLSRYSIGSHSIVTNCDVIAMRHPSSSFGVGYTVSVMNETGGLEVPLSRALTAQTAYLLTMMDLEPLTRQHLMDLFGQEQEEATADVGYIGAHVTIKNCGTITDAWIDDYTTIVGAISLHNCSLCSVQDHPIHIGHGVIAQDMVVASGAVLANGCVVERCFVGQSCHIDHLFSAHDSLLFSNCSLENGEACAVFAGPFTVSCHKSSLLIAGYFAFLNAGSGSNQSNHLYKLGPVHRGVVERGSKTSSDSYILWPARVGAFSLVMGRHVHHVDTTDFPFSYVIENKNESYLIPGRNLYSVGTMRDARKWPSRDKRPVENRLDCINYNLLSPFTIGKMERGYNKLTNIEKYLGVSDHTYVYYNINIKPQSLKRGREYYRTGIEKFLGNSLIQRIEDKFGHEPVPTIEALRRALLPDHQDGSGEWMDVCGMITPTRALHDMIIEPLTRGAITTIQQLNATMRQLHKRYYDLEWDWSYELMMRWYRLGSVEEITYDSVCHILGNWIDAVTNIDRSLYNDARKEYDIIHRVSLGTKVSETEEHDSSVIDDSDFEQHPVVLSVQEHIEKKQRLYDTVLRQISLLSPDASA